jgi:hypothetical protein
MSFSTSHLFSTICRALIIIAAGMGAGYLFYGSWIFVPTSPPSQFTLSSIAAGLFYGLAKSSSYRNALTAILIWYVISTFVDVHNGWLFILFLVYIAAISAAVYVYMILVRRPLFNGILQRVATMSLLIGIVNALAIPILSAIQSLSGHVRLSTVVDTTISNFQLGTLIGLGVGVGIEIAEYLLRLNSFRQFIEGAAASDKTV